MILPRPTIRDGHSFSSGVAREVAREGAIFGYLPMRAGFPVLYSAALDSARAEEFAVEHVRLIYAVAFSRDGTLLATVGGDSVYASARSAKRMGTGCETSKCLSLALAGDVEHWLAD